MDEVTFEDGARPRLLLLVLFDPSEEASAYANDARAALRRHVQDLDPQTHDAELAELPCTSVRSLADVAHRCEGRSRVVVWYVGRDGRGKGSCSSPKPAFACFEAADGVLVHQDQIVRAVPRVASVAVVFDCGACSAWIPVRVDVSVRCTDNASSLFDFEGALLVQAFGCVDGGPFTRRFVAKFRNTYRNTLGIMEFYASPGFAWRGATSYDKYLRDEEPIAKRSRT